MGVMALRKEETLSDVRQIGAMVACGVVVMHIINPDLLSWTEFPTYAWIRWAGLALSSLAVGTCVFAARDELTLARARHGHTFDPPGLFRWVRHPIELVLVAVAVGLTLLSANWVVALLAGALAAHEVIVRAPRVERERRAGFGDAYEQYARVTPAFLPRLSRSATREARERE